MADTTAPILTELTLPSRFEFGNEDLQGVFSASATDSESGVKEVVIWLDRKMTDNIGTFSLVGLFGLPDSWADGTSSETRTVSHWNAPGTYSITRVDVRDKAGNERTYTPAELRELGFATSFEMYMDGYRPTEGADILEGSNLIDALYGYGGDDSIKALDGNDSLFGGDGNDSLDGGASTGFLFGDSLVGGAGNDTYFVDNAFDLVVEAGVGTDTVYASQSYTLSTSASVEFLRTSDATATAPINLTGSSTANSIFGNAGANVLSGKGGDDHLYGGLGRDKLYGGLGRDQFVFDTRPTSTNKDTIYDFNVKDDTIRMENSIFTKIGANGYLKAGAFWTNNTGKAHDKDDRVIYDRDSGVLYYDPDGTGSAKAVAFTTISKNLSMRNKDVYVI